MILSSLFGGQSRAIWRVNVPQFALGLAGLYYLRKVALTLRDFPATTNANIEMNRNQTPQNLGETSDVNEHESSREMHLNAQNIQQMSDILAPYETELRLAQMNKEQRFALLQMLLAEVLKSKEVDLLDYAKFADFMETCNEHIQISPSEAPKTLHVANVVLQLYGVFRDKLDLDTQASVSQRLDDVSEISSVEERRRYEVLHCSNPRCCAIKRDYEGVQHVLTIALYKLYLDRTNATSAVIDP
jgi:hypothetical protein